jgi:hypothetical protein
MIDILFCLGSGFVIGVALRNLYLERMKNMPIDKS